MLIAPASCNTIAKMAHGLCDNLLLAVYLSSKCPVLIAPAMDEDMWNHASTRRNVEILRKSGNMLLPVNSGELASGLTGEGRMAEPEEIMDWIDDFFSKEKALDGAKVLITAGPTYEAIDPVRFIGNRSTGTMGIALAVEMAKRGADVSVVLGPSQITVPPEIKVKNVTSSHEMYEATIERLPGSDIIIMAAAVSDYTLESPSKHKIKKENDLLSLNFTKTKDILAEAGALKKEHQILVGFALETNNERENALKKLAKKNADMVILNSLNDDGAGFGRDTNKIIIFDKKGKEYNFEKKPKTEVAKDIVNAIINYRNA
jgi:phosphopantothenoylcysteine decarboxylase / phosphopantothenate---cysteine ligase